MNAPERINVVFVLHALAGGGAERVAVQLVRNLDRQRFRPVLALFRIEGPYLADVPDDVPIIDLKKRNKLNWPRAIRRLARVIRREQAHVVFGFDWHANMVSIAAAKIARRNTRVIAGVRSHESTYIPQLSPLVRPVRRATIRRLYPHADLVLANSGAVVKDLEQQFRVPGTKLVTVHNPVDVAAIEEQAAVALNGTWFPKNGPVVIAAGRLITLKGFDVLIDAVARVRKEKPCTLVILGDGPEEEALRNRAAAAGIVDHVRICGFQSNPFNLMKNARVFVLSSYTEGFPNVVLEAMACGTPVVATRCSAGPEEIITDGVDGMLVPPGNAAAMADAISRLLNANGRADAIGAAGYARVQAFSLSRTIEVFEDLFVQVVNSTPSPRSLQR